MPRAEKKRNYKKRTIKLLVVLGALVFLLALMLILRTSSAVSEWMAVNISRGWISVFGRITGIFPFSFYELLLYVLIPSGISIVIAAIVMFCRREALRAVSYLLIFAVIGVSIGNIYTVSAGFTYYRGEPDLPKLEAQTFGEQDKEQLIALAEFMVDDFNALAEEMERDEDGRTVSPYSFTSLAKKLQGEYKRIDSDYYSDYTPLAKPIVSKRIMSNMHLSGVFFAPFGEANVNPLTPACDMPVTMAHELAHAKGAMRESDANLTAYYITVTSDDPYLRYTGYISVYSVILRMVGIFDREAYMGLIDKIDGRIFTDMRLSTEFWESYTLFDDITEKLNDFYLKLSGQGGTNSYFEPTNPPEVTPRPSPDGDGTQTEITYAPNTLERTLLAALTERAKLSGDEKKVN